MWKPTCAPAEISCQRSPSATTEPLISVTPTTLPQATSTQSYSQQLTASGGTAPYTWILAAGALPGGISGESTFTLAER